MAAAITNLSELLVQKSFKDCSVEELRQLTEQYPYFSPAHFLLLKKFDPASEEYRKHYQKAILYFHDPLSFDFFLHRDAFELPTIEAAGTEEEEMAQEILDEPLSIAELKLPELATPETKDEISFEPFHTVDYFASQGIQLAAEENASPDKFGRQLKSFTDWLKTMKRLPSSEISQTIDVNAEKKVANLADHSVNETEIVTEAMAEVWQKQGNHQKAKEVYEKLSLLNPSKRAYFAAKIQHING